MPISQELRKKIALFCNVRPGHVIQSIDAWSIYQVPLNMEEEGLDTLVVNKLGIRDCAPRPELSALRAFLDRLQHPEREVNIAMVGKYVELQDAYKSIQEAFVHAGAANHCRVNVNCIHSEHINDDNVASLLKDADGVLVAPGFGERGIPGKIATVKYAREKGIPFFGICLGMQMAVVEFARDVLGYSDAASVEMDGKTSHPVIDLMEEQKTTTIKGGTMRLGAYACRLVPGTLASKIYGGADVIYERHRHRYEFNDSYRTAMESAGLLVSGINPDTGLVEIIELPSHPFFIGTQFHPEFKSTPEQPQPIFTAFIQAALKAGRP